MLNYWRDLEVCRNPHKNYGKIQLIRRILLIFCLILLRVVLAPNFPKTANQEYFKVTFSCHEVAKAVALNTFELPGN
jgi:hypothetical protein